MSKKLEEKQARRLAEERKRQEQAREARKRNLITVAIALAVVVAVVAVVLSQRQDESGPVGVATDEAQCGEVEQFEALAADHIEPGTPHPPYNSSPPTSGPHYAQPAQSGFYDNALEPEQPVHNLEHGQIVIWFDPDAPQAVIDDIEAVTEDEFTSTVATPYEGEIEGGYNLVLTAWTKGLNPDEAEESHGTGYWQGCQEVSESVVNEFRREYQGKSPEPLTPPFEG